MKPFTAYAALVKAGLPKLVRRQRRLERQVVKLEDAQAKEKAVRDEIDLLLKAEGFKSGEGVLCVGYEVKHNERAGREYVDAETLLAIGVSPVDVRWATKTGKAASFATVKPPKGALVRA